MCKVHACALIWPTFTNEPSVPSVLLDREHQLDNMNNMFVYVDSEGSSGGSEANDYAICPLLLLVLLKCRLVRLSQAKRYPVLQLFHEFIRVASSCYAFPSWHHQSTIIMLVG